MTSRFPNAFCEQRCEQCEQRFPLGAVVRRFLGSPRTTPEAPETTEAETGHGDRRNRCALFALFALFAAPWGQEGDMMHEDRPREWDIRLAAGPVPIGESCPW